MGAIDIDMYSNDHEYLIPEALRPAWLAYPVEFVEMVMLGRVKLVPWKLYKAEGSLRTHNRFKTHLGRDLVPFAHRQDREDLACFERGKGHAVMIIHDNTDPGYEDEGSFLTFTDWLRAAEEEAASWIPMPEEYLRSLRNRFGFHD
jgi:hypothetical protein